MDRKRRPVIGITPGYDADRNKLTIGAGYVEAVAEAGGLPFLLPLKYTDGMLDEILERCDGILLSGGADLDAQFFGEPNYAFNGEISPYRDKLELALARRAVELSRPVLGICRGIQVLNVALGGTLYQDIQMQVGVVPPLKHSQQAPGWYPVHDIRIEPGSRIEESFGGQGARVNSYHHQAVKDTAPGLRVTSTAADGVIEAIEHPAHRFVVGVQWHPELMWQENRIYLRLFEDFIGSARGNG